MKKLFGLLLLLLIAGSLMCGSPGGSEPNEPEEPGSEDYSVTGPAYG